jgi:hypothetical protein
MVIRSMRTERVAPVHAMKAYVEEWMCNSTNFPSPF